jgi:hypothetical protein
MGLEDAIAIARRRVAQAREEKEQAERRERSEARRPGLDVQVTSDWIESPTPRARVLPWVAGIAFLIALPLCALFVGAFDPRLHTAEDVRRMGVQVLGYLRGARPDAERPR